MKFCHMKLDCRLIFSLIVLSFPLIVTAPNSFAQDSESTAKAKLRMFGHPRGRAPNGWTRFEWPQKRKVLFNYYAPTKDELNLIDEAIPTTLAAPVKQPRKLLVFYRCQYPHTSIATANAAYQRLAKTGAFEITLSDDPADITTENLAQFDALLLNNTTDFDITVGEEGKLAIVNFVKSGKGLIGIHAAADSCKRWLEGKRLLNGIFACHPWLPKGTWAFELEDPDHPLNQPFDGQGFWARDEIYAYRPGSHSRDRSRILVGLDMTQPHNKNSKDLKKQQMQWVTKYEKNPVAWIHEFGEGRVFYSNFGHNNTTYWNPLILKHYLAGIQYALGDLEADAVPSSKLKIINLAAAPERTSAVPVQ